MTDFSAEKTVELFTSFFYFSGTAGFLGPWQLPDAEVRGFVDIELSSVADVENVSVISL